MIYFIQQAKGGPIKIGYTRRSTENRLVQLQTASPVKLYLLAEAQGYEKEERSIHRMFDHLRLEGEWFSPSRELYDYIDAVKKENFVIGSQNGKYYPVLSRSLNGDKSDPCPFCGEEHLHGIGDGHRNSHCWSKTLPIVIKHKSGKIFTSADGYILRSRSQELGERGKSILESYRK